MRLTHNSCGLCAKNLQIAGSRTNDGRRRYDDGWMDDAVKKIIVSDILCSFKRKLLNSTRGICESMILSKDHCVRLITIAQMVLLHAAFSKPE